MPRKRREEETPVSPIPRDPPTPAPRDRKLYTPDETAAHKALIVQLLPTASQDQIIRAMRDRFGVGRPRTRRLIETIHDEWKREDAENNPYAKAKQVRRIMGYIAHARGEWDAEKRVWKREPNHQALARWETMLANMHGTFDPVRVQVDVTVSQSIQHVIANLTPEQVAQYRERHRQLEEKARAFDEARALPPAKTG